MTRKFTALFIGAVSVAQFSAAFAGAPASLDSSVHPNLWPDAPAAAVAADQTDRFVDRLLRQLTLEEKVGQRIQPDIASISAAGVRPYRGGSILPGRGAAPA